LELSGVPAGVGALVFREYRDELPGKENVVVPGAVFDVPMFATCVQMGINLILKLPLHGKRCVSAFRRNPCHRHPREAVALV
jgi:hypothetical protein